MHIRLSGPGNYRQDSGRLLFVGIIEYFGRFFGRFWVLKNPRNMFPGVRFAFIVFAYIALSYEFEDTVGHLLGCQAEVFFHSVVFA